MTERYPLWFFQCELIDLSKQQNRNIQHQPNSFDLVFDCNVYVIFLNQWNKWVQNVNDFSRRILDHWLNMDYCLSEKMGITLQPRLTRNRYMIQVNQGLQLNMGGTSSQLSHIFSLESLCELCWLTVYTLQLHFVHFLFPSL